jgi:hypothetical protein
MSRRSAKWRHGDTSSCRPTSVLSYTACMVIRTPASGDVGQDPTSPPKVARLLDGPIDIVGDVHGEIEALQALLQHLGYSPDGRHAAGRRLVFIGDLVDRGPDSPHVLGLVQRLVHSGRAQCLLGNHELNLLREARKEGNGWFFADDHDQAAGKFTDSRHWPQSVRGDALRFFAALPLALERADLRLVHACWHAPSIEILRRSPLDVLALYRHYDEHVHAQLQRSGLQLAADAEEARHDLHSAAISPPLLRHAGAADEATQMGNPVRIVTSGIERLATAPFHASGKWRMVERVRWWDNYVDAVPVIIGHYWRWPAPSAQAELSRGEPDLFAAYGPQQWLGARSNVFCVDFSVGARYKERAAGHADYACRLAAVRWPERQLVFDDGRSLSMN